MPKVTPETPNMFEIEVTGNVDELFDRTSEWDSLARGVPFRQSGWLRTWWCHFGEGKTAFLVLARDREGILRGILPLYRFGQSSQSRSLAMMGSGAACSDHVSVLASEEDAVEIGSAMGRHLAQSASDSERGWNLIDIDGVVEGDKPMAAFASGLSAHGATLHTQSRMSTWFVPAADSWQEQLKRYGKTQRRQMRRAAEKIDDGGPIERLIASSEEEVEEFTNAVIEMHQRRWQAEGQQGSYADPNFRNFMMDAVNAFAKRQQLYLTVLTHEGRIVGGELNFVGTNKILYSYTSGYALDAADLGPGRILRVDSCLQMYREGLAGIDYMRGDETYKTRMTSQASPIMRLRAVAPALMPRIRHAAWCTGFELKQWVRRRTGRTPITVLDITSPQMTTSTSGLQYH